MAIKFGLDPIEIWQALKKARTVVDVASTFSGQVKQIDQLFSNDKTGLVSTITDFMVHSATVNMKIETENDTLNKALENWQTKVLNKNVNIDVPLGLRALSEQYFRERWRSSLLPLKVQWGEEKLENQGTIIVPKKMWFLNGGAVKTKENGALNTREFSITVKGKDRPLKNKTNESIFIRKPYNSWHEADVTPYLVRRGTLFNALVKNAIVQNQSDVIEVIMPILLKLSAGTDALNAEGLGVTEEQFKELKDKIVNAKERFKDGGNFGDIIASLRHDVNLDYLVPELGKIFDEKIVKSTDRNLLSSLGLIELQGFSSTRQEAILNPKVLVEEVTDAVLDWADLLQDVMLEMLDRNKIAHPNISNGTIQIIPGIIKAFLTDEMKTMLRSLYDRGIISRQNAVEDIGNINFEVQVQRRDKENKRNLHEIMKPPVIQNLEPYEDEPIEVDDNNLEDQNKKPGTPEADNFNNAILQHYGKRHLKKKKKKKDKPSYSEKEEVIAPYENIDELPDNVKNVLPVQAQLIWLKTFNSIFEETEDEERAIRGAWSAVKEKYEKDPDKDKWVKKANLSDYEQDMSPYAYRLFNDMYETAVDNGASHNTSLKTALSVVEKVCVKNKSDVWVKDKKISKDKLDKIDNPSFVEKLISLEMNEKKLKLLDRLLADEGE